MADYAGMYRELFREVSRAIDILQKAQQSTEETYISSKDIVINILPPDDGDTEQDEDGDC